MSRARVEKKPPRASIACTRCRSRRVRCDVSRRGHPCINCEVDGEQCVVLPRSNSSRIQMDTIFEEDKSSFRNCLTSQEGGTKHRHQRQQPVDITFQAYPFIKADFFTRMGQDEIAYLDSQSCFRLPVRSTWNSMVQVYFRNINPLVPVLNELAFRELCRNNGPAKLSLFLAQAMLFAACPYASQSTAKRCGFANCREARVAFYQRAKLLYKLESDLNSISIIQGCLLLSLCSSPQPQNPVNSVWLSIAIQHAQSIGGHGLQEPPGEASSSLDWLEFKRLWWVCLVRDRIISLGYRRPLQIVNSSLDAELNLISSHQVCDEMCRTELYSNPVSRALFFVFLSLCRLCAPLTKILTLFTINTTNGEVRATLRQAEEVSLSLQHWLEDIVCQFEKFDHEARSHSLVVLHYHLLHIYFHVANVHTINFKITTAASESPENTSELGEWAKTIEASVEAIASNLSSLAEHRLVEYMPTGAIMCTVLPFVINSVHVEMLPPAQQTETSKIRSEIFLKSMRALQTRRNHVNPIIDVIQKVLKFTQPNRPMSEWKQTVAFEPGHYPRVLQTLDLVLSTGMLRCPVPEEQKDSLSTPVPMSGGESKEMAGPVEAEHEDMGSSQFLHTMIQSSRASDPPMTNKWTYDGNFDDSITLTWENSFGHGAQMADSRPEYPLLRDIFGLCHDQDIDTLLSIL